MLNRLNPFFFLWSYFTAILPLLEFFRVIFALASDPDYIPPARVPPKIFYPDGCGFYIRKH
jgi:hypothetical protein